MIEKYISYKLNNDVSLSSISKANNHEDESTEPPFIVFKDISKISFERCNNYKARYQFDVTSTTKTSVKEILKKIEKLFDRNKEIYEDLQIINTKFDREGQTRYNEEDKNYVGSIDIIYIYNNLEEI